MNPPPALRVRAPERFPEMYEAKTPRTVYASVRPDFGCPLPAQPFPLPLERLIQFLDDLAQLHRLPAGPGVA